MKKLNKVIAIVMMMTVATAMPAMAETKTHPGSSREYRVAHHDHHRHHAYRPDVRTVTFKVSRHATRHHNVEARAEHLKGVIDARWNPRTRELTVRYDARTTTALRIMHAVD